MICVSLGEIRVHEEYTVYDGPLQRDNVTMCGNVTMCDNVGLVHEYLLRCNSGATTPGLNPKPC